MHGKNLWLSIIIPVYNPRSSVVESYRLLGSQIVKLIKANRIKRWDVIIVDNGCTDNTPQKLMQLKQGGANVTILHTPIRGIGLALNAGLAKAKGDLTYFTSVDHPFKLQDLNEFIEKIGKYDLLFASKNNPESVYRAPFKRKLASLILSSIVRILFNLPLSDTQGTFIVKKGAIEKILPLCNSPGPFFQAQLAINAKRLGMRLGEIPVSYQNKSGASSFSLFRDGSLYLYEAIKERFIFS